MDINGRGKMFLICRMSITVFCVIYTPGRSQAYICHNKNIRYVAFSAFQWWFWIENRSIIKGVMAIFVDKSNSKLSQTIGGAFIRRVHLLCRVRYFHSDKILHLWLIFQFIIMKQSCIRILTPTRFFLEGEY